MAFGWAGAGAGAAQSLEEIVAQRLMQQRLEEEIRMQEAALAERQRSSMVDEGQRGRSIDLQERALNKTELPQRDPIADYRSRKQIDREFDPPPPQKRYPVTTPGQGGKPISRLASEDEMAQGVPVYEKPDKPTKADTPDQVWVVRGGKLVPITKGTAQAGDEPYDAVKDRKQPSDEPSPYASERATRTIQSVDELLGQVNRWTVGAGSALSMIPETDARSFKAQLDTLKANIAFNELTAMREASKTGGALGQVSNIELGLLESALGALDRAQSPTDFRNQLLKVKASVERWQKAAGGATGGSLQSVVYVRDANGKLVRQ